MEENIMNKKERTIKAIVVLTEKYKLARETKEIKIGLKYCSLCKIFRKEEIWDKAGACRGCPSANIVGSQGCVNSDSYTEVVQTKRDDSVFFDIRSFELAVTARLVFWDMRLPIIKLIPSKYFTRKGWRFFDVDDLIELQKLTK